MTPGEKNILDTLNLLVFLLRSQTHIISITGKGERNIIYVNKEDLAEAGLSIPTFINTLELLTDKRYLISAPTIESKDYHTIKEVFSKFRDEDIQVLDQKLKDAFDKVSQKILPVNSEFNLSDSKHISVKDMFEQTEKLLKSSDKSSFLIITLMPFRSISRLLEKLNSGISFDDIQDDEIWYDNQNLKLHVGKKVVNTSYKGGPSRAHFLFDFLFNKSKDLIVDYSDISQFDMENKTKENRAYADSVRNLFRRNKWLKPVFSVHSDRLEVNKNYKTNTQ